MFRWPWTLWRHYTFELLKLLALTAGVLVSVIAFGGAIKPISDGLLQAGDAIKFMLLSVPPMLAYALPFAGGFAATLVYHRVSGDLEAIAAYASGISHRRLLAPALALALVCGGSLVALNEQVIPRFLQRMAQMITVDVVRIITRQIERGQSAVFGDVMMFADGVRPIEPDPSSDAIAQLLMTRFGAVELSKTGAPATEVTAGAAKLWLLPEGPEGDGLGATRDDSGRTRVILQLLDVVAVKGGGGIAAFADTQVSWVVPNTFRDNVKFLTWRELTEVKRTPERLNWIEPKRRALAYTLAERRVAEAMAASIRSVGTVEFVDEQGRPVTLRAAGLDWDGTKWAIRPTREGLFEVRMTRAVADSAPTQVVIAAPEGYLSPDPGTDPVARRAHFRIDLARARVRDASEQAFGPERATLPIPLLTPAQNPAGEYLAMPARELVAAAEPWLRGPKPSPEVWDRVNGRDGLAGGLRRLDNDVLAKRHERLALATSCMVMILCGAVTALKFARRLPLTVYLFSFFPALAAMVTISGGQQMTVKQGPPGLILMWGGVAALAVYTSIVFLRLRKH